MRYSKVLEFVDIKNSLLSIWKNITKCFVLAFAFLAVGILLTFNQSVENYYIASTSLYIAGNRDYNMTASVAQTLASYTSLIRSQRVAERALSNMGNTKLTYRTIQNMISYSVSGSGIDLTISAASTDPQESVMVANAVSNAFVEEMRTMTETDAVQVLSAASSAVVSKNGLADLWKLRLIFFAMGFIGMAVVIFVREFISDKIRTVDQCILTDEDVVLGIIPEVENNNGK